MSAPGRNWRKANQRNGLRASRLGLPVGRVVVAGPDVQRDAEFLGEDGVGIVERIALPAVEPQPRVSPRPASVVPCEGEDIVPLEVGGVVEGAGSAVARGKPEGSGVPADGAELRGAEHGR